MKVGGVTNDRDVVFGPITFKRGTNQFLAFYAKPVWDLEEFNALCPPPVNKSYYFTKDKGKQLDPEAPAYLEDLQEYYRRRWGFVMMKSLEPSNIEWDTVKPNDPNTWGLVESELRKSLSIYEFARVAKLVDEANALDEAKLEENAQSFFQLRAARIDPPYQNGEAENSKSFALANASE